MVYDVSNHPQDLTRRPFTLVSVSHSQLNPSVSRIMNLISHVPLGYWVPNPPSPTYIFPLTVVVMSPSLSLGFDLSQ